MQGAGTDWKYQTKIASIGTSRFEVSAKNKEGKQGTSKQGVITTARRPTALVNVAKVEVNPKEGFPGDKFTFVATTDKPAKGVTLAIGRDRHEMTGSGKSWSLAKNIERTGTVSFSIIAKNG